MIQRLLEYFKLRDKEKAVFEMELKQSQINNNFDKVISIIDKNKIQNIEVMQTKIKIIYKGE